MRKLITCSTRNRALAIVILIFFTCKAKGQPISAVATLNNYSIRQKRLLAVSTTQFINFLTQSSLDQDSVMSVACRITGLPFLLPYNENFQNKTLVSGTDLVNAGKIPEAERLLKSQQGENRIQLLLELGLWYVHQPGSHKTDIANARRYARDALTLSSVGNYGNWQIACLDLLGECYYQSGDTALSKKTFLKIVAYGEKEGNIEIVARASQHLGKLLPFSNPMKLIYFNRSLKLYQDLKIKEKEMELLWNISGCNLSFEPVSMEKNLRQIIALQQSSGFKHTLYSQSMLAYVLLLQAKFLDGLGYANAALENMKWSGVTDLSANFYMRVGNVYSAMEKYKDALIWYKKGLQNRTKETQLFWFKNFINATYCLRGLNKFGEELSLINGITKEFPPLTEYEKVLIYILRGNAYEKLKQNKLADDNYTNVIRLIKNDPNYNSALLLDFADITEFYLSRGNTVKAVFFMKKVLASQRNDLYTQYLKYALLYKTDSAGKNYGSAFRNHLKYQFFRDSLNNNEQRTKLEGLTIKYGAEKKDRDIKLLKQQRATQQAELTHNKLIRNIMFIGAGLLLLIVFLLFSQFRLKQRSNKAINKKNRTLELLLAEKEWLLKEVHHRVKNNLHTVICLLESQAAYLENDALKAIENSQHRIYAMSLIHQKLYQSDDIKTIDMSMYLPEFVQYLNESFGTQRQIRFQLDIQPLMLGISQAIPLALIINEAVTNAIKYAFPEKQNGIIDITMHQKAGQITLVIGDNGVGINHSIANAPLNSLGLKLMKGLSEDINASINFANDRGTRITIAFNVDPLNDGNNILKAINHIEAYTEN